MRWKKIRKIGSSTRDTIAGVLLVLGYISLLFFGVWGLVLIAGIVFHVIQGSLFTKIIGIAISVLFFPFVIAAAPWYALFVWGDWFPLKIVYGGAIISYIIIGVGDLIRSKSEEER